jgi:chromosome segregation ATPase
MTLSSEKEVLSERLAQLAVQNEELDARLIESERHIMALRLSLSDKDNLLTDAESKMTVISTDTENLGQVLFKQRSAYENELKFMEAKLHASEIVATELRQTMDSLEMKLVHKEEAIASTMATYMKTIDENNSLRQQISTLTSDLQRLSTAHKEAEGLYHSTHEELQGLRDQHRILKDETLKDFIHKLAKTETHLR